MCSISPHQKSASGSLIAAIVAVGVGSFAANPTNQTQHYAQSYQKQNAADCQTCIISVRTVFRYVHIGFVQVFFTVLLKLVGGISDDAANAFRSVFDLHALKKCVFQDRSEIYNFFLPALLTETLTFSNCEVTSASIRLRISFKASTPSLTA